MRIFNENEVERQISINKSIFKIEDKEIFTLNHTKIDTNLPLFLLVNNFFLHGSNFSHHIGTKRLSKVLRWEKGLGR